MALALIQRSQQASRLLTDSLAEYMEIEELFLSEKQEVETFLKAWELGKKMEGVTSRLKAVMVVRDIDIYMYLRKKFEEERKKGTAVPLLKLVEVDDATNRLTQRLPKERNVFI